MSTNYCVVIEKYAQRHYIKNFAKKYGRAWDIKKMVRPQDYKGNLMALPKLWKKLRNSLQ